MAWPNVYNLDSSKFDRSAAISERSTFVLVHDAFHTSYHFERLARELREVNYDVIIPQLPSSTTAYVPSVFQADVQAVYEHSRPVMEAGRNLVFVLHGYSGLPGSVAAERINRYALTRPRAGFVVKIVFIAAIVANEGECFLDLMRATWMKFENDFVRVERPDQVFFHDCALDIVPSAVAILRPQLADSFQTRTGSAGWIRIPCCYIVCRSDEAVPPSVQQACVGRLQTLSRQTRVLSMEAGHSPYLSQPGNTANLLIRISNGS